MHSTEVDIQQKTRMFCIFYKRCLEIEHFYYLRLWEFNTLKEYIIALIPNLHYEQKRNGTEFNLMRSHLTDLTTSFARVPNSLFCLFEPRMSLVASLTPRALFLVRIVFTVALKSAVLSILKKPAEIPRNR